MDTAKILAFAGSTRSDSFNKKLVKIAAQGAREAGAEVTVIDLRDYALPLYDGDFEAANSYPENALLLKQLFSAHQGWLIASPEYNSGYSAVLKNAIDWVSRPANADEISLSAFKTKKAALMAAAPGALGGLRGLYQLRELLLNMNVTVLPQLRGVAGSYQAFDDIGQLKDDDLASKVAALGSELVAAVS